MLLHVQCTLKFAQVHSAIDGSWLHGMQKAAIEYGMISKYILKWLNSRIIIAKLNPVNNVQLSDGILSGLTDFYNNSIFYAFMTTVNRLKNHSGGKRRSLYCAMNFFHFRCVGRKNWLLIWRSLRWRLSETCMLVRQLFKYHKNEYTPHILWLPSIFIAMALRLQQ